ncbi:MAG: precorrin-6A reductase [Lachnospiraceae bacterium]|nr:precorrin-6A reductase [Lachnospiraceae bacterium]
MKPVLIYSGTTEGKKLANLLAKQKINTIVCVATEYGEMVMEESDYIRVNTGRLSKSEMAELVCKETPIAVIDATHPFAKAVSEEIKDSIKNIDIPYYRLSRDTSYDDNSNLLVFDSIEECVSQLKNTSGNILLTTGSKDLEKFCTYESIKDRLFVRVIPSIDSISLCEKSGIFGKQIIAMQGPFSVELNMATIRQYNIKYLVTKESGKTGGVDEKIEAANKLGIKTFMIANKEGVKGISFSKVVSQLEKLLEVKNLQEKIKISLIGIGMGNPDTLTMKAKKLIEEADYIFGAERIIEPYNAKIEKKEYYLAKDIIPYIDQINNTKDEALNIVVLFSGDTGFYSGCNNLNEKLKNKGYSNIDIVPGISTISYLASRIGICWNDAKIISLHGVCFDEWKTSVFTDIKYTPKIFFLLSNVKQLKSLAELLKDKFGEAKVILGYQLSYKEETITYTTVNELNSMVDNLQEGLYAMFLFNEKYILRKASNSINDEEFIRGKAPMTKAEVRDLSISKLKLNEKSIVYDIGSGTGSVAVGIAGLSGDIKVYAIECNKDAVSLIDQNITKFGCSNVFVIKGMAPSAFRGLEVPDCAFIGGTRNKLFPILEELYKMNNNLRVVINAISMETAQLLFEIPKQFNVIDYEVVQIQINRAKMIGNYNMMHGENPIFVCSFNFVKE